MLNPLKEIGEEVGPKKAFGTDLLAPYEDEKIAILEIKEDEKVEDCIQKVITFDPTEEYENYFYYQGGNDALVGGTMGIGGVSPFFMDPPKLEVDKIDRSEEFNDFYEKEYNDSLVEDLLNYYRRNGQQIRDLDVDWIYVDSFMGQDTEQAHNFFIQEYLKAPQNKDIDWVEGTCTSCGSKEELRDIRLPFFSLDKPAYNFDLKRNEVSSGRLKLCQSCELKVAAGWKYINNVFGNYYALLPAKRNGGSEAMDLFFRLANENANDFEKLNNLIGGRELYENLEFRFLVTDREQSKLNILRSVDNYHLFAKKFEDENLVEGDRLKYVHMDGIEPQINQVRNYFDLERVLKSFFLKDNNYPVDRVAGSNSFHFYHLYNRDLPRNTVTEHKHLLFAHRDELFSFIYESNLQALREKTLDEIVQSFLRFELRNLDVGENFSYGLVRSKILNGLNNYYFLRTKILGDKIMRDKANKLEGYFEDLSEKDKEDVKDLLHEEDSRELLYYLVGQLIRKVDNFRGTEGKNQIFDDFLTSLNRKNASKRFAEEILQGQNYYIQRLSVKSKFVFDLLAESLEELFEDGSFPKIIISLTAGYYSKNILGVEKGGEKDE